MSEVVNRLTAALSGRYGVERELGQGGMATVYLAHDLRHDRKVALKVLRPELAAVIGASRFLAEIKTTASLQHPHILPLHDSGEAAGTVFYVMPYVEGESLRDRLRREKQLPVDEAIRIAREVASALDYAHRHHVVHRDIKPENILLHDGQALVADFGIALAVSRSDGGTRMTETGMSLGTPHYMAPEQAMGDREVGPKADVYALGVVLYEMLSGDPPFTGSTAQAIVARVVTESPRALVPQRHTIPPHVEAAVFRALEKLPADRFASAGDFAAALENSSYARVPSAATAAPTSAPSLSADWRRRLAIPFAAIATLATMVAVWALARPQSPTRVARYALAFPVSEAPNPAQAFDVSPDGSHFAYIGPGGTGTQLWVKARDQERATPLAGTNGVLRFTFSPDGQWIAFTQGGQLKKVPVIGGAAITLADSLAGTRGVAWLDNGTLVYAQTGGGRELRQISDVGGQSTTIWKSDSANAWNPAHIPGSRGVLFLRCRPAVGCPQFGLWVADLRSKEARSIVEGAVGGRYVPTGHVAYVRVDGGMLAIPFSARSLSTGGSSMPLIDSVSLGVNGAALFAVSSDGTLFVRLGASIAANALYEMVWLGRTGRETLIDSSWTFRLTTFGGNVGWALSPDGNRLAIGLNTEAGDHVWVKHLPRGPLSRVSFDGVENFRPRWLRDGKSVMFISRRNGNAMLYKRLADGTGGDEVVFTVPAPGIYEGQWGPDGRSLALRAGGTQNQAGGRDIMVVSPGDTTPKPLVASQAFDESGIAIAPNGRWVAYESNETGRTEVYIRPFPNADAGKWQVSTDGGRAPLWARSGRELFFVNGSRDLVVVPVAQGSSPDLGVRKTLFHLRDELYLADQENYTPFDISPDGQRFLMARRIRTSAGQTAPLVVVENWFEELKRRVGKK